MNLPLFVYGTLMAGQAREGMLAGLERSPARVRGALYALPAGYPAMTAGDDLVYGELVSAPDPARLALLDAYEGVDEGLYRREAVDAIVGLRAVRAWAWTMADPAARGGILVRSGRWRAIRRR